MTESPKTPRPDEVEAEDSGRPTIRDKRRIDPETYELREPSAPTGAADGQDGESAGPAAADPSQIDPAEIEDLKKQVADRTADLQRVQAEYVNYKRRVDRDRDLSRASGVESVLTEFLPVLDSVRAAREHGELTGGFKAVADEIEKVTSRHGLEAYGEPGDPFDPQIHEALMTAQADQITVPTCVTIMQPGYKLKGRVIRPARVAVAEPELGAEPAAGAESEVSEPSDDAAGE